MPPIGRTRVEQVHGCGVVGVAEHDETLVAAEPDWLSQGFWWLHWRYAEYFKREYDPRRGHVFGGRPRMICMIATPQEEEAPARAPDEQEDAPSEPDQKD